MKLVSSDLLILLVCFAGFLFAGFVLRSRMKTGREFLLAGRSLPAWICGVAFLAAGLGVTQLTVLGGWGARYGLQAARLWLIGAIPPMLFAGLFLMPLYYGSKARTVPEFLGMRFDGKTRVLNAWLFAAMTVVSSGIALYAMARILRALHIFDGLFRGWGWPVSWILPCSIVVPAAVVLVYVALGGLRGAIYNQAVQFLLVVAVFLPVVLLGLRAVGGWGGLVAALPMGFAHEWVGGAQGGWMGLGLGLVLGMSFWCADFRVIQMALAAKNLESARRVPLIAAGLALFVPLLLVLPGLVAIALPTPRTTTVERIEGGIISRTTTVVPAAVEAGTGLVPATADPVSRQPIYAANGQAQLDYELATPNLLVRFLPTGLLGLGLAALLAGLMSGVAANATAFNSVVAYDILPTLRGRAGNDEAALRVGRWATAGGILLAVGMAFAVTGLHSGMEMLLPALAVVNAPLFAVLLAGMFWKRATGHGAFAGLVVGGGAALLHHGLTLPVDAQAGLEGGWIAVRHSYPNGLVQGLWTAVAAFCMSLIVMVAVSLFTKVRAESELAGLVYGLTPKPARKKAAWWKRPEALAAGVLLAAVVLSFLLA